MMRDRFRRSRQDYLPLPGPIDADVSVPSLRHTVAEAIWQASTNISAGCVLFVY